MSEHYRGFEIPEVSWDAHEKAFFIVFNRAIFDGYSSQAVLDKWRLHVDCLIRAEAIKSGYMEISETVLGCPLCGSLVWDAYAHKTFHEDLTKS